MHRLEVPDVGIGHVLGHRVVPGLPLDGFIFRFQILVGLQRAAEQFVHGSIMFRTRKAPLRTVEPVAGHLAAAGLVGLFPGDAGGDPGFVQEAADRFEGKRQLLLALREQDVLGLREVFAQGFLVAAQVPAGRLAPDDVIEQVEMVAHDQLDPGGQVRPGEQVEGAGRFQNAVVFGQDGNEPGEKLGRAFPLVVPRFAFDFVIRRIGRDQVDAVVGQLGQQG